MGTHRGRALQRQEGRHHYRFMQRIFGSKNNRLASNVKDPPSRQLGELVTVSILDNVEDVIVQPTWRESVADGE